MTCKERLEKYFQDNGVPYQTMTHPQAFTAQEVAAAQRVSGRQVAKVVIVKAGEQMVMLVLPASYRVDFRRVAEALQVPHVRLATEDEFIGLFPDCLAGAMPPFGNLYNLPLYVDASLTEAPEIVFQAGTHVDTIKIRYEDYARLAQPHVAHFALQ
jgi:Ala-tRNA(Pro) deacylase